jgi:hypothetical protein
VVLLVSVEVLFLLRFFLPVPVSLVEFVSVLEEVAE